MSSALATFKTFSFRPLRELLSRIYKENHIYRIPFGPLRGMRMRYFHSLQYHMILGLYDSRYTRIVWRALVGLEKLGPGKVFCDIGANIGVYSLWFSRLVPKGRVYAFEPMPECFKKLEDNLALNSLKNVTPVSLACSNTVGTANFFMGNGSHEISSFFEEWATNNGDKPRSVEVNTTTLDSFFSGKKSEDWPDFIKMDIEGGGVYALQGCDETLSKKRPVVFIESHTPDEDRAISNLAIKHSYDAYRLSDEKWVENIHEVHPSPQGVWGTLLLTPKELHQTAHKILK